MKWRSCIITNFYSFLVSKQYGVDFCEVTQKQLLRCRVRNLTPSPGASHTPFFPITSGATFWPTRHTAQPQLRVLTSPLKLMSLKSSENGFFLHKLRPVCSLRQHQVRVGWSLTYIITSHNMADKVWRQLLFYATVCYSCWDSATIEGALLSVWAEDIWAQLNVWFLSASSTFNGN